MPRSTKKKKEKQADFVKAKLKVGKGKAPAANAIDTTFKARSIVLPHQTISAVKSDGVPTTKRKLTFDDLLGHLKHYNANVRKDALLGLRELFEAYTYILQPKLSDLVNGVARLFSDEDPSVRKTLIVFIGWLLPRVKKDQLTPHSPVLLLFTTSALTHIFPDVRIDAVRILNVLLEHIPDQVTEGWERSNVDRSSHGSRVLSAYMALLNIGDRFGSSQGDTQGPTFTNVVLTLASKLVILKSILLFMKHITTHGADGPSTSTRFMTSSFSSDKFYEDFNSLLFSRRTGTSSKTKEYIWQPQAANDINDEDFAGCFSLADCQIGDDALPDIPQLLSEISRLHDSFNTSESSLSDSVAVLMTVCRTLQPVLTSIFLDCAPSVFSPGSSAPENETSAVNEVIQIVRILYIDILTTKSIPPSAVEQVEKDLKGILNHMSPHFPFMNGSLSPSASQENMNLAFCELFALHDLASRHVKSKIEPTRNTAPQRGADVFGSGDNFTIEKRVTEFVLGCLRGEIKSNSHPMGQVLTTISYAALLPTVWSLVNDPTGASEQVLEATVTHGMRTPSTYAVKVDSVTFIGKLLLLQSEKQYVGKFRLRQEQYTLFRDWMLHLPKTLWEAGSKDLALTEIILLVLLRSSQRKLALLDNETSSGLRNRMIPYFVVQHRTRGEVLGPFSRLPESTSSSPSSVRRLVLDVVHTLCTLSTRSDDEEVLRLKGAVEKALSGTVEEGYWRALCAM